MDNPYNFSFDDKKHLGQKIKHLASDSDIQKLLKSPEWKQQNNQKWSYALDGNGKPDSTRIKALPAQDSLSFVKLRQEDATAGKEKRWVMFYTPSGKQQFAYLTQDAGGDFVIDQEHLYDNFQDYCKYIDATSRDIADFCKRNLSLWYQSYDNSLDPSLMIKQGNAVLSVSFDR